MTASQTVTASFIPRASAARLLFRKAGTGAGYVSTLEPDAYESPLGFRCGPECLSVTVHHPPGTLVKLSASADNGSSFTGWGGEGCGGLQCLPCRD